MSGSSSIRRKSFDVYGHAAGQSAVYTALLTSRFWYVHAGSPAPVYRGLVTGTAGLPFPIGTCTVVVTSRSVSVAALERSGSTRAPVEASAARRVRQGLPFVDGCSEGVVRPTTESATANIASALFARAANNCGILRPVRGSFRVDYLI